VSDSIIIKDGCVTFKVPWSVRIGSHIALSWMFGSLVKQVRFHHFPFQVPEFSGVP